MGKYEEVAAREYSILEAQRNAALLHRRNIRIAKRVALFFTCLWLATSSVAFCLLLPGTLTIVTCSIASGFVLSLHTPYPYRLCAWLKETWNAIQNLGAVGPDDIDDFMPPPGERQLSRPFQRPPSGYYFERDHLKELEEKCLIGLNPEDAKIMSSHIELYRLFRQSQIRRSEDNSIDLARSALDSDSDSYSESEKETEEEPREEKKPLAALTDEESMVFERSFPNYTNLYRDAPLSTKFGEEERIPAPPACPKPRRALDFDDSTFTPHRFWLNRKWLNRKYEEFGAEMKEEKQASEKIQRRNSI